MPTLIKFPKDVEDGENHVFTPEEIADQEYAIWVRKEANEYGTTTTRPRDILHFDLEFTRYNALVGNINQLAVTHLDVAKPDQKIKVCTHYKNAKGEIIPYEPDLKELKEAIPQYIELPGWDGKACRNAKSFDELPDNAKRFLAFVQAQVGLPIIAATTGPKRDHYVEFDKIAS